MECASLLAESQMVPEPVRNQADCFAILLTATGQNKCPMEALHEATRRISPASQNKFAEMALILTKVETPAQLEEAVRLMDDLTAGKTVTEDEALALLTICRDRHRALGLLGKAVT